MSASPPIADTPDAAPPQRWRAGFAVAWIVFWLLMTTVAVQDHLRQGLVDVWRPLLWEGSSCVVATALAWWYVSRVARLDSRLHRPWAWFARTLRTLPIAAPLFVAATYSIRHAAYALLGLTYLHEPWTQVFFYETLKFSIFFVLFVAVVFGVRSHDAMLAERLRAQQATALSQQAQLLQLTQQLEPHFLFNALNTIAATVHDDAERADALLTQLAALLRAATDLARKPTNALADELRLLEGYAAIMRQRFGDRLSLRLDVDAAAEPCIVPTLVLQPLLENAFRHGVERRAGPAHVVVAARREGDRVVLQVEDDVGALPDEVTFGVGLANLQQRLAAAYGDRASLSLSRRDGGGVVARIELPCGREG